MPATTTLRAPQVRRRHGNCSGSTQVLNACDTRLLTVVSNVRTPRHHPLTAPHPPNHHCAMRNAQCAMCAGCVTKMLVGRECGGAYPSRVEVERAKWILAQFTFVGYTDDWGLSMCALHSVFGGTTYAAETGNVRPGLAGSASSDDELASQVASLRAAATEGHFEDWADGEIYDEARRRVSKTSGSEVVTPGSIQHNTPLPLASCRSLRQSIRCLAIPPPHRPPPRLASPHHHPRTPATRPPRSSGTPATLQFPFSELANADPWLPEYNGTVGRESSKRHKGGPGAGGRGEGGAPTTSSKVWNMASMYVVLVAVFVVVLGAGACVVMCVFWRFFSLGDKPTFASFFSLRTRRREGASTAAVGRRGGGFRGGRGGSTGGGGSLAEGKDEEEMESLMLELASESESA